MGPNVSVYFLLRRCISIDLHSYLRKPMLQMLEGEGGGCWGRGAVQVVPITYFTSRLFYLISYFLSVNKFYGYDLFNSTFYNYVECVYRALVKFCLTD